MRIFRNLLLSAALAVAVAPAHAEEGEHWRLFVADHGESVVRAVDLADGAVVGTFELSAPARLYRTESERTVFAVQRDADAVSVIDTGILLEDHGDHADLDVSAPRLLEATVEGDRPVHFVAHDGRVALFFDGEGVARIVTEAALLDGDANPAEISAEAPHHGVAATFGDHILVSVPNPDDPTELPIGIQVLTGEGDPVGGVHACPGLHGEAASGSMMAFGCEAGLLIVESGDDAPSVRLLPYPDDLPEGKTGTLLGGVALRYFLGNYGPDAVVVVDPSEEDAFSLVRLPARRVDFAVDPARPRFAYALTEDGDLHKLDVMAAEIVATAAITRPYSMDGHWSDPRPRIAVAGDEIVLSDPLAGVLRIIDPETLQETRRIDIDGMPYNLVAVGGSGLHH
ncbi:zinc metallochaperone AztD [Inquilinus sp. CAU 1745]|uniref:zinc metallochaperone AztD n=1 Tax=Inquilinus sp. CAU 1745 TaxID=3140369 RepID=UPI00325B3EDC